MKRAICVEDAVQRADRKSFSSKKTAGEGKKAKLYYKKGGLRGQKKRNFGLFSPFPFEACLE